VLKVRAADDLNGPSKLLDLPFVFSQATLLTPREVIRAAKERGLDLREGLLEALHRAGLLFPLYRVQRDLRGIRARAKAEGWHPEQALIQERTDPDWLISHREAGLLHDPSEEAFVSWSRYRRQSEVHPYSTSNFLYSPYQLLNTRGLRRLMRYMRRYGSFETGERFRLVFPKQTPPLERTPHR
jgi:hypothetical protein